MTIYSCPKSVHRYESDVSNNVSINYNSPARGVAFAALSDRSRALTSLDFACRGIPMELDESPKRRLKELKTLFSSLTGLYSKH